jgi:hypothetical protein
VGLWIVRNLPGGGIYLRCRETFVHCEKHYRVGLLRRRLVMRILMGGFLISKYICCVVLMIGLCANLAASTKDQGTGSTFSHIGYNGPVVGPIVGALAGVVVIAVVVVYYSKKRAITGCVAAGANGMTVTDEKDRRIYPLSGDTADIKPGERMKLRGRKVKSKGPDKALGWQATKVSKDFGVCPAQP